ncbi:MAG TPA: SDR family oxidoreductase [Thermohalobaculum sp.]|nr:SDR family oxidoreductase [Thermohalobaculum sp.]
MPDRVILITGASSGIGAASARAAAEAGWKVALAARSEEKLAALVDEIGSGRALAIPTDVTDEDSVKAMVAKAAGFGPLAAAFANAGTGASSFGAEQGDTANWRQMVDINIWGLLLTVRHALPELHKAEGGHMLLTGSQAGRTVMKGSVYGATKWFVHAFRDNLAQEMKEWGGRCTVIAPGMVDTPFFDEPKPEGLRPEDVARAVVYALEQPAGVEIGEIFLRPV